MSELSFLVSLLLDHKLPKPTQKAVKDRITEVEQGLRGILVPINGVQPSTFRTTPVPAHRPSPTDQPESTRKLLEKYPDLAPKGGVQAVPIEAPGIAEPEVQGVAAATAATANALAQRQQMINEGIAGPKKGSVASPKAHGTPRG